MKTSLILVALAGFAAAQNVTTSTNQTAVEGGYQHEDKRSWNLKDIIKGWGRPSYESGKQEYEDDYKPAYAPKKYDDYYPAEKKYDEYEPKKFDEYEPKKYDDYEPKKYDEYEPKKYDVYAPKKYDDHAPKKTEVKLPILQCPEFKHCKSKALRNLGKGVQLETKSGAVCSWKSNLVSCNLSPSGSFCTVFGNLIKRIHCDKSGRCEPVKC